ncbi:hypothetical protein ACPC54_19155 [Kitasatospora sp. NPDC094028]
MRQTRTFAVIGDSTGSLPLVFDPLTGVAHRGSQPLPTGRVAMDHQQVTGWPEERRTPVLAVGGPSRLFTDQRHALPVLEGAGIVAVNLLAADLDEALVHSARWLSRAGLLVTVTTSRPGLPQLAEELTGAVHALRVQLRAPTEYEHDRLALPHQARWEESLNGVLFAVDAGLPVQLLVEAPPSGAQDTARLLLADAAARLAAQTGVCGLTLLLRPGALAVRSRRRGAGRTAEAETQLLPRRGTGRLAIRIGIGRAERAVSGLGPLTARGSALTPAGVA